MSPSKGSPSPERVATFAGRAVLEYADLLRNYLARHLRKPQDDVDDLTQQVYLRLIRMSISPSDIKEPKAFIRGVARKVLSSHWMAHYRDAQQFPSEGRTLDACTDLPSENLDDNPETALDLQQQLMQSFKGLPPMQAACVVLRHREGMSREEIAAKLGLRPDTVRKHLIAALAQIRKRTSPGEVNGDLNES